MRKQLKDQRENIQECQPMRGGLHPQLELQVSPSRNPDNSSSNEEIILHTTKSISIPNNKSGKASAVWFGTSLKLALKFVHNYTPMPPVSHKNVWTKIQKNVSFLCSYQYTSPSAKSDRTGHLQRVPYKAPAPPPLLPRRNDAIHRRNRPLLPQLLWRLRCSPSPILALYPRRSLDGLWRRGYAPSRRR